MNVARLSDMPEWEREHHLEKIRDLPDFGPTPWVDGPALSKRRVAVITTAGLQLRSDIPFKAGSADYRVIPAEAPAADIVMSHVSVNYDRTGFQEDVNVVLPLDRLRELKSAGLIGSVADFHYSFMGAAPIRALEPKAAELAGLLKKDRVDAVLLSPV
jgi:D-proline reductase (dithiol) PrdB